MILVLLDSVVRFIRVLIVTRVIRFVSFIRVIRFGYNQYQKSGSFGGLVGELEAYRY